ncbi:MAG TPA: acetyl-CoA carboxylase carboxyltransferase subunit alpha [Clostridia bacterium]
MNAYEKLQKARSKDRETFSRYLDAIFDNFYEFHGDRRYADDPAVIGGVAFLDNTPVTVIGLEKGVDTKDKIKRNFGMANPEGYRKALRLMKQAEKFSRPIICFIDTSGAYCGIGAEERGQGQAISQNLVEMSSLACPIIAIVIGEGGSGGALALSVADEIWMLENAVYSVISPEGCASILWKDAKRAPEAAERLKITAEDLVSLGIIDKIIPEKDFEETARSIKTQLCQTIKELRNLSVQELKNKRYLKYRNMGNRFI